MQKGVLALLQNSNKKRDNSNIVEVNQFIYFFCSFLSELGPALLKSAAANEVGVALFFEKIYFSPFFLLHEPLFNLCNRKKQ